MFSYPMSPRAWGFTRGVSRVLGIDLMRAVFDGWLRRDELGAMVETCSDCGQTSPCGDWLAHTASADALPQFCPNKAVIEALKP